MVQQNMDVNKKQKMIDTRSWKSYLVEFRGIYPDFRYNELFNVISIVLAITNVNHSEIEAAVNPVPFIMDTMSDQPIGVYISLPGDDCARTIAYRCCTVRRIIEVWGTGVTPADACNEALSNYDSVIDPTFAAITKRGGRATWKVVFERYGKGGGSGLNSIGRDQLLTDFDPVLRKFTHGVDLKNPSVSIIYLEDWYSYQSQRAEIIQQHLQETKSYNTIEGQGDNSSGYSSKTGDPYKHLLGHLRAERCIFGRIVGEGRPIPSEFDLKLRPYLGTTSMNATCAHLAVNAARVMSNSEERQLVFDPFCGTGSLLIAAAYCGADVVGSDIDADCLGLLVGLYADEDNPTGIPIHWRSKNARFKREKGLNQSEKSTLDNFRFYGLEERVKELIGVNAACWVDDSQYQFPTPTAMIAEEGSIQSSSSSSDGSSSEIVEMREQANAATLRSILVFRQSQYKRIEAYRKFDAIVTDPPFGVRERAFKVRSNTTLFSKNPKSQSSFATATNEPGTDNSDAIASDNSSTNIIEILFRIAVTRIKKGGWLVFWLPTESFTSEEAVKGLLTRLLRHSCGESAEQILIFKSIIPEKMNSRLWRWLCVYQCVT